MILLDAGILIRYLRKPTPAGRRVLDSEPFAVVGVTRTELLCGASTPAQVRDVKIFLAGFASADTPEVVWTELGAHSAALRMAGITVPFPDAILAAVAMHHDVPVWASDAHFPMMRAVLPALKLYVPPTAPTPP